MQGILRRILESQDRLAQSERERMLVWKGRKAAFAAAGRLAPNYIVQDGVIPRTRLPEVLDRIGEMAQAVGLRVTNVFHAGDGNLHPIVLYDASIPGQEQIAVDLSIGILRVCVDLGGSITGEHGVGREKQESMGYMYAEPDPPKRRSNRLGPMGYAAVELPHDAGSEAALRSKANSQPRTISRGTLMSELIQVEPARPSNFDVHHPQEKSLIEDCVHCGFCLPACPTYVLWGEEMDSPRGRIYMMNKVAQGEAELDHTFQKHMDNCLGCMACMTACPSGVEYGKLIEDTRAQMERNIPRTTEDSLFRKMLFATFPYPQRLRLLALPMMVYQRSGLQTLVRSSGVLKLLPERLAAMEALLPRVPARLFTKMPARVAANAPRRRVGMLSGCVQQVFFQHVNQATARVLVAEGCEVVIPQDRVLWRADGALRAGPGRCCNGPASHRVVRAR